jgi:hypothetical protein
MLRVKDANTEARVEEIRLAMSDALKPHQNAVGFEFMRVHSAISNADDVQALWYLRSDLFSVLSASAGENVAFKTVEEITEQFEGLVAASQFQKPARASRP